MFTSITKNQKSVCFEICGLMSNGLVWVMRMLGKKKIITTKCQGQRRSSIRKYTRIQKRELKCLKMTWVKKQKKIGKILVGSSLYFVQRYDLRTRCCSSVCWG